MNILIYGLMSCLSIILLITSLIYYSKDPANSKKYPANSKTDTATPNTYPATPNTYPANSKKYPANSKTDTANSKTDTANYKTDTAIPYTYLAYKDKGQLIFRLRENARHELMNLFTKMEIAFNSENVDEISRLWFILFDFIDQKLTRNSKVKIENERIELNAQKNKYTLWHSNENNKIFFNMHFYINNKLEKYKIRDISHLWSFIEIDVHNYLSSTYDLIHKSPLSEDLDKIIIEYLTLSDLNYSSSKYKTQIKFIM